MTNEEKILEILVHMQGDISELKTDVAGLKTDVAELKTDVAELKISQANLETEMNERFDTLEDELKYAWQDIKGNEDRIKEHEQEFHKVG